MTSGERMVWAAEFVRHRAITSDLDECVLLAATAVLDMRRAGQPGVVRVGDETRAMLSDMLSTESGR